MGIRISTPMLYGSVTRGLFQNLERVYDAQEALATQKKIQRPGDDPAVFRRIETCKGTKRAIEQYQRNISFAQEYLAEAETSVSSVANLLARARELAVQGANGTLDAQSLSGLASEVGSIREEVLSLANAQWTGGKETGSRYLFSGYRSETAAFSQDGVYQGDSGAFAIDVAPGERMTIGLVGSSVFQADADIPAVLDELRQGLESGDADRISGLLDDLDRSIMQVSRAQAEIGARMNRLDQTRTRLEDNLSYLENFVSSAEDLDIIEAASRLTKYQSALQATMLAAQSIFDTMLGS